MTNIIENPYIAECDSSTFTVLFDTYKNDNNITFIHGLLKYPEWSPTTDIFQYIQDIDHLQKPNTYFLFDASTEGFCPFRNHFFDMLYYNCKKYNISPNKVLFLSTNMLDEDNIKRYNKENNITKSIRVFTFLSFKKMILDLLEDFVSPRLEPDTMFEYFKNKTKQHYVDKYVLSLSRVNRPHRTLASYLISNSAFANHVNISQDKIDDHEIDEIANIYKWLSENDLKDWSKKLPFIVDTKDFEFNHALKVNSHLHHQTLFQIVNETHVKDWNKTSIFFSEKTFRTIGHMQPFLIFGQQGCNHKLEEYGFKLYTELFDYSFDFEPNVKRRYQKLLSTVEDAVNKLNTMTHDEQIEWKYSCAEKIKHNFKLITNLETDRPKFEELIKELQC
jgi:hypothetical protein